MPLRDFAPAARNGTVPESSYIFADVSGLPLAGAAREVRQLFARVSVLRDAGYAAIPAAAGGRPILSVGGWGHGRPFHSHGPALNGLTAGVKHWFIRRPNASEAMAVPPGLQAGQPMPERWEAQMWMCTQNIGDVLWIPDRLEHATANYADLAVSLFTVIDDLSETPLIAAAKAGDELAVKTLLAGAPHNADTAARSRSGGTALTYAAGVGCAGVVRQLLVAGADVGAATSSGATALHAATFGGHVAAVEALLEGGARIDARDGRGQTALELALQREDAREVRKLLEQAAAAKGGEDAFFADPAIGAFGVADGVGGSARQGVDPGIFSRMMLSLCHRHLAENAVEPPSPAHLTRAMEASGTALARNPIGGSSTVLLGQLSNLTQSLTLPLILTLTLSRCSSASSTARPRSSPWSTSAIRRR